MAPRLLLFLFLRCGVEENLLLLLPQDEAALGPDLPPGTWEQEMQDQMESRPGTQPAELP